MTNRGFVVAVLSIVTGLAASTAPQLAWSQPSPVPPKVLGLTVREAKQRLQAAGWNFGVQRPAPSYWFDMPIITDRAPDNWRACDMLWVQTSARLVLFPAPACVVRIPRLIGKSLRAVLKILHPLGLHVHDESVDPRDRLPIDIGGDWVVCQQQPRAGSRASLRQIHHFVRLKLARRGHCP